MRNIWGDLENCSGREQFGKCRSLELDSLLGRSSRQPTGRVRAGGKAAHVIRRDGSRSRTSGSPVQVRTWLSWPAGRVWQLYLKVKIGRAEKSESRMCIRRNCTADTSWNFGVKGQAPGRQLETGNPSPGIRRFGIQNMLLRKEFGNHWKRQKAR